MPQKQSAAKLDLEKPYHFQSNNVYVVSDVAFCQSVLNATIEEVQRTQVAEPGPSSSGSAGSCRGGAEEDAEGSSFKWKQAAILLLLELYRQAEPELTSGKTSQKKVWANIPYLIICTCSVLQG